MIDKLFASFHHLHSIDIVWLIVGFSGQILFTMRMLMQWISSEKKRRSVIPLTFWYFSIIGGICLLIYAIHLRDPVFLSGQLLGVIVYLRNIYFIYNERKSQPLSASLQ